MVTTHKTLALRCFARRDRIMNIVPLERNALGGGVIPGAGMRGEQSSSGLWERRGWYSKNERKRGKTVRIYSGIKMGTGKDTRRDDTRDVPQSPFTVSAFTAAADAREKGST